MQDLVSQARQGSIRAATRLISLLEEDPARLPDLFAGLDEWPSPRLVLGLTGAPGVGKSTLVDRLLKAWRRVNPHERIGVVAVDPSSPFTGGAVLGDRVRMMKHATDPEIFIRSLASRGHLGGLTLGIRGTLRVMGLVGCRVVLIETVGVGQSEVEVAGAADLVAVLLAPGQGDGVQMLKAGLMEVADLFVVNKCDRPGAERLAGELLAAIDLGGGADRPPVHRVSASQGQGVEELVDALEEMVVARGEAIAGRRREATREEVHQALLEGARARAAALLAPELEETVDGVLAGRITVSQVLADLFGS